MKNPSPALPLPDATLPPAVTHVITHATPLGESFVLLAEPLIELTVRRAQALEHDAHPEQLHKLRVALRRLRTLWWAYQPLMDRALVRQHKALFKTLANAAGQTRDWDVLGELLAQHDRSLASQPSTLLPAAQQCRERALVLSRAQIQGAAVHAALHDALAQARAALVPGHASLAQFAASRMARAQQRLNKRLRQVLEGRHSDYAALHALRIAAKKVRYLIGFFLPVLPEDYKANAELLAKAQDNLGRLNDIVVSLEMLREPALALREPATTAGMVRWLESEAEREARLAHRLLHRLQ